MAQSPVIGEDPTDESAGSVELIGSATYFVKSISAAPVGQPDPCLPRELPLSVEGDVLCALYSATYAPEDECQCGGETAAAVRMVEESLEALGRCGEASGVDCADYCICSVPEAEGESATDCLNNPSPAESTAGWCYVDPSRERGAEELVAHCPPDNHRMLRILPEPPPGDGPTYVFSCVGGPVILGPTDPGPGALGTPCFPGSERRYDFRGFSVTEVGFEFGSPDCASNTCLINHFQGRVSCPYGQTAEQAATSPVCSRPGPDGQVTVAVDPQLLERRADEHAICSCRCAGSDPSESYCDCPSDMECVALVPETGVPGEGAYVGKYCIPRGTRYDPIHPPAADVCVASEMNCR